jgi:hypothetical protein
MSLRPLDLELLRRQYAAAKPFPFIEIEGLLDPDFALEVASVYPSFAEALRWGHAFKTVNEKRKIQITDSGLFPGPVRRLHDAIASPAFLGALSAITGIPNLLADEQLAGGGMHLTGPGGRLDVHVDFNYIEDRRLHRRLNLLLYLNPVWEERWGGAVELWDRGVERCAASYAPVLNRCILFETSDISYHGVTPVSEDAPHPRCSFAAYYYTREAPANWRGTVHSTIFRARPDEVLRGYLLMPAEKIQRRVMKRVHRIRDRLIRLTGG